MDNLINIKPQTFGKRVAAYLKKLLKNPFMALLFLMLLIYSFAMIFLLIWGVISSFKTFMDFFNHPFGLPKRWIFDNYSSAFKNIFVRIDTDNGARRVGIPAMFFNSFLYAGGCAFFSTATSCLTAYMSSKFPYKFSKVVYTTVIIAMVLPIVGSLPSEIRIAKVFGLYDSMIGMWAMKLNFLGIYFLVFYSTFKGVPQTYAEAAYIDGAGNLRLLWSVMLPLVKNVFLTVLLLKFIEFWNDYQIPLLFMPTKPTMAYGMYLFNMDTESANAWPPMKITACVIMMLPILIIFLSFSKRLMGNVTMGGIKG